MNTKRKPGRPPLPDRERRISIHLKLPPAAVERLRRLAEQRGESQADVVVTALSRLRA